VPLARLCSNSVGIVGKTVQRERSGPIAHAICTYRASSGKHKRAHATDVSYLGAARTELLPAGEKEKPLPAART